MKGNFFENISHAYMGIFFKFFIAFISTAIYIRVIGVKGFAIIGIVYAFFNLVHRIDIPYFLSLVKFNEDFYGKKKNLFEDMFNTLYNSLIFGNIFFFILLSPLVIFLSTKVYNNTDLLPFYFLALFTFLISRVIFFLNDFLRANGQEAIIQRAYITNLTSEFVITMVLLLIFDLGVLSIFIGIFVANFFELVLLYYLINKRLMKFKFYFSSTIFFKTVKGYTFQNYISKVFRGILLWGGLFLSTFYLDTTSLGILTILISVSYKLRELFYPFEFHLIPLYSNLGNKKKFEKIKRVSDSITSLLFIFCIVSTVFFLTIGKHLYLLYFGSQMKGTYFEFLLIALGVLFWMSFSSQQHYLFALNIKLYNKILAFAAILLLTLILFLIGSTNIFGIAISYFIAYFTTSMCFLYYANKASKCRLNKENLRYITFGILSIAVTLIIYSKEFLFSPIFSSFLFIALISFILITNAKKIIKIYKYLVFYI